MNYFALHLLRMIHSCELNNCPGLIPKPAQIRIDPLYSDALDYLLDCGYVRVLWKTGDVQEHTGDKPGLCLFDIDADVLSITDSGRRNFLMQFDQNEITDIYRLPPLKERIPL